MKLLARRPGRPLPDADLRDLDHCRELAEAKNDIGFFAQPGADAAKNGVTIWMPAGTYIPKTTKNLDVAKDFLAFIASVAGAEAVTAKVTPPARSWSRARRSPTTFCRP